LDEYLGILSNLCIFAAKHQNQIDMEIALDNYNIFVPKADAGFLRDLAKKRGWEIVDRENLIRKYFSSRPNDCPLTEDEILEEVMNVRY
jgi:hypothetical protein